MHRDVKSGNVRVTPDGRAVLIDYGSPGRPSSDVPAGTPGWLSPEVAAGHAPGHAADVVLQPGLDDAGLRLREEPQLHRLQMGEQPDGRAPITLLPTCAVR